MSKLKLLNIILYFSIMLFAIDNAEANIILKIMAVNPSKGETQKVPLKAYLPKEVKPDDIIDKGDLDIAYDTQQGSYFVFGEYELKPGEAIERQIEINDIWKIQDNDIESLRLEIIRLTDLLKNTEFAERIFFFKNSIEAKLNQITENQKAASSNPARQISDYRDNLKILETVKADLVLARGLLSQAKPLPYTVVWKIIIAIVIFLGFVGATFYFIWQKQIKIITQETPDASEKKEPGFFTQPARYETEEKEKSLGTKDIEKILEEEKRKKEETY